MLPDVRTNTSPKYSVAIYEGALIKTPAETPKLTWPELAEELGALANAPSGARPTAGVKEQKRSMVAWAPHVLREPYNVAANVEAVTLLVLDVDRGDPDAVVARLESESVAALLYESPTSTPEHAKFRVVVPVTEPISPEQCRATRIALAEALGLEPGCGVEECCNPDRILFAGKLHGTPDRRVWHVEGDALDVRALPTPHLAWGAAKAPSVALKQLADLPPADAGIAAALGDWREHDRRKHDLCGAVGGLMRKGGYSAEQCAAELRAWLPTDEPDVDVAAGVRYALRAWGKHPAEVSGHGALAELLGTEHARVVERAAADRSPVRLAMPPRLRLVKAPLVAKAPGKVGPAQPTDYAARVRAGWDEEDKPLDYYCEGLRLAPSDGKINLIAGLPGAGKGPIADHLAVCFATGKPAFGKFPCRKSRVLLIDAEGEYLSRRRAKRMARALGVDMRTLDGSLRTMNLAGVNALDPSFQEWLGQYVADNGFDAILVDSYTSAMLNSGLDSFKPEFAQLASALGSLGRFVLAVAHANKAPAPDERPTLGNVAGSFALAAMAQTGITVWHPDFETEPSRVSVACMRAPETGFEKFDVEFTDVAGDGLALSVTTGADKAREASAEARAKYETIAFNVMAYLRTCQGAPKTERAIASAPQVNAKAGVERPLHAVLGALHRAGILHHTAGSRRDSSGEYTVADSTVERVSFSVDLMTCAPIERGLGSVATFTRAASQ